MSFQCLALVESSTCNTSLLPTTTRCPLLGLPGRWRRGERVGVCMCVFDMLLMLQYFVCPCVHREIKDGLFCRNPPPTAQASVDHFNLPPHVSEGTGLFWNLAHSTGWGNQLRPDWQPPFLIPFPRSLSRVLFLLLWSFFHRVCSGSPPPPPLPSTSFPPPLSLPSLALHRHREHSLHSPAPSMHSDPHSPLPICPPRPLTWFLAQVHAHSHRCGRIYKEMGS